MLSPGMTERIRYMRLVLFFDLPVGTPAQRKAYRQFVKYLTKAGYLRMQESVFSKLVINDRVALTSIKKLRENKPPPGIVQVLKVTEKEFAAMEFIVGEARNTETITTTEELLIL